MVMPRFAMRVMAVCAWVVLTGGCARGASQTTEGSQANRMNSPDEAAKKAIDSLPQLVTEANFRAMGFRSLDEVKSARLGPAVPRHTVSYERLLQYQPGAPLHTLFAAEEQMVFPIEAGGAVRSTVATSKRNDRWQIAAVGDAYLSSLFAAAGPKFEIVSIPGLNLEFGGIRQGDEWTLIPVQDYPQLQFTRDARLSSRTALPAIAAHAREFDKLYGDQIRKKRLVK